MHAEDTKIHETLFRGHPFRYLVVAGFFLVLGGGGMRIVDAGAINTCHETVTLLNQRLEASNQDLRNLRENLITKIHAESPQLPPSFVSTFEEQLSTGVYQIQKSNTDALGYSNGKAKFLDMLMRSGPPAPNSPLTAPAPKSETPLPQLR